MSKRRMNKKLNKHIRLEFLTVLAAIAALALLPIVHALPKVVSFDANPLPEGKVQINYKLEGLNLKSVNIYRDDVLITHLKIKGDSYSDYYFDDGAIGNKTYVYKIFVQDDYGNNSVNVTVTSDAEPPVIVSSRNITINHNTITVNTNENSICRLGFSSENMRDMYGEGTAHSLNVGLVPGVNKLIIVCTDRVGNTMFSPKIISVYYDNKKPSKISKLKLIKSTEGFRIEWDKISDNLEKYVVYYDINGVLTELGKTKNNYYDAKGNFTEKNSSFGVSVVDVAGNVGSVALIEIPFFGENNAKLVVNSTFSDESSIPGGSAINKSEHIIIGAESSKLNNSYNNLSNKTSNNIYEDNDWFYVVLIIIVVALSVILFIKRKDNDPMGLDSYLIKRRKSR